MRRIATRLEVASLILLGSLLLGRAAAGADQPPKSGVPPGLEESLARREYEASPNARGLQAPNRAHDLRTYFEPGGVRVHDRTAPGSPELLGLSLARVGRAQALAAVALGKVESAGARVEIRRPGLVEWYVNSEAGLEHGFTLAERPAGAGPLVLELALAQARASLAGDRVILATGAGRKLAYGALVATDAKGGALGARFEVPSPERLRLVIDDAFAVYPLTIDPLLTETADAQLEADQSDANLGWSVAAAGDVNGDGYADVIVGAYRYDAGETDEGAAFVFRGGPAGIASANPGSAGVARLESNLAGAELGYGVAGAGDVNGDGYADVIVGAPLYQAGQAQEGAAFVFLGGPAGIANGNPSTAAAQLESNQASAQLGVSVAGAGDVNGDGYADVIVGANFYTAGQSQEGAAFVFLGGPAGIASGNPGTASAQLESNQVGAELGLSVAGAGDVNGDGYADVIVGAWRYDAGHTDDGGAFVFLGSPAGIASGNPSTSSAQLTANQLSAQLGVSVAGAGDVNGDGFADVIVGANLYDAGQTNEGAAFVFLGSGSGVATGNPSNAAAQLESDQANAELGISVAGAGDVNGDGFADVIVGAHRYDAGQTDEGAAFVYLGSVPGIANAAAAQLESNQASAELGDCVAGAGDVNGDGYADLIVGARLYDAGQTNEGAAFVYLGGNPGIVSRSAATANLTLDSTQTGAQLGISVAGAGDVNADGLADWIVGAPGYDAGESEEGAAFLFLGSPGPPSSLTPALAATMFESNQANARLGGSVARAGDVNGDGYADVIVGAPLYDAGQTDEGAAFVFLGGATPVPNRNPTTAAAQLESNQANALFGMSVASAGDVNGDGFADVIVGAPAYDAGEGPLEGAAFVFLGSGSGVASGNPATASARLESNQASVIFGHSVAGAGDVNGDGYADVIVGSPEYSAGQASEGAAFVFLGGAAGIPSGNPATAATRLESNQASASFGESVAGAGDVNGDGYADLIIGAGRYDAGQTDEGAAFVFLGSGVGVPDGNPATASAQLESNQATAFFGKSVAGAGDVNGDGYADVIVGALVYDAGQSNEGAAFVFLGSATGVASGNPATAAAQLESDQASAQLGISVAGVGDVNGDGFADVIAGADGWDGSSSDDGGAFVFYANAGGPGRPVLARQLRGGGSTTPVQPWGSAYDIDDFQVRARATDPRGRERVKLQIQVCPAGVAFGHASCTSSTSPSWTDVTASSGGATLTQSISGLAADTPRRWRARVLYAPYTVTQSGITAPPNPAHGPWRRLSGQALEVDLRISRDTDGDGILDEIDPDDDNDGLLDSFEIANGFDPLDPDQNNNSRIDGQDDFDADGLGNAAEAAAGTNPTDSDTDNDGLLDGQEIGTGIFGAQLVISTAADGAIRVLAADVDGDGDQDVVSASLGDSKIAWYENDGTPWVGAWSEHTISTSVTVSNLFSVFVADVDGDGDRDVLSASYLEYKIAWYENDGTPAVGAWAEHVVSTSAVGAYSVFAADMDGDGDVDVLSASWVDNKIAWYENDGTPAVGAWSEHAISTAATGAASVFAADLDGDGDTDVLSASYYDDKIAWYENDGTPASGAWVEHAISTVADGADSVFAADLDGDGDMDVLSASYYDDKIAWYENDGTPAVGAWTEHAISTAADGTYSVFAADVDGDGDTDVLSASYNDDKVAWYENDGTPAVGAWSEHVISTAGDGAYSVFAADVDGDGDTDVLSASFLDDKIAWYRQQNVANPADPDSDDDGLNDGAEVALGTNPLDEDTDDDLVCDGGAQTGTCTAVGPDNCPFIANFAQTNGDAFAAGNACQCGDVLGDGTLNAADYQRAREWIVNRTSGPFHPERCDVNGDTSCDVEDLAILDRLTSGAPATLLNSCPAYYSGP